MKIDDLLWTEIQEIRIAIEERKQRRWDSLAENIKKGLSFEEIKELKEEFDANRNRFTIEGKCNKVLEIIQKMDLDMQKEMEVE